MSEMVERVARALKAEIGRQFDAAPLLGDTTTGDWHATGGTIDLEECAREAITAMRVPTGFMVDAIHSIHRPGFAVSWAKVWRTMIDAALAEQP